MNNFMHPELRSIENERAIGLCANKLLDLPYILWVDMKALDNLVEMPKPTLHLAGNYRLDPVFR